MSESVDDVGASSPPRVRRGGMACRQCRERKVRCSGACPCANCVRRTETCVFDQEDRKMLVSESYINELKRKAAAAEEGSSSPLAKRQQPSHRQGDAQRQSSQARLLNSYAQPDSRQDNLMPPMTNPLVSSPSKFVTDTQGRKRFLGPSSTWAYSRHAMSMIRQYLDQHESPEVPLNTDGAAFAIEFPNMKQFGTPIPKDNLPPLDYALYLINTVKFHISQTYHLFQEDVFLKGLFALYTDGPQPLNAQNRLWYVQYFIVIAFGKALLSRTPSRANPSGCEYFVRALELFPDANGLYQDPILAVEICCSLALYLQSVDHRNSAYVYLGLGLRIALSQGLHRDLLSESDDSSQTARYRSAWWTLYILDRKFSSLMGAPSSIHDNDISVPLPPSNLACNQVAQKATLLDMHVKLSRVIAKVLGTVYGMDGRLDSSFLRNVQTMLRELASLGAELNSTPELKIDSQMPISRASATLNLCYHQCIVLATRPLLVCLLRDRLEETKDGHKSTGEIVEPVKALLRTAHDSATKSLRILSALQSQDLVEFFLPFDLDHTFSAGFVLSLLSAITRLSEPADSTSYLDMTFSLLDTLIEGGNAAARFRRQELGRLHDMLRLLRQRDYRASLSSCPVVDEPLAPQNGVNAQGISPNEMLNVASLLDDYPPLDFDSDVVNSWLWEAGNPAGHVEGAGERV